MIAEKAIKFAIISLVAIAMTGLSACSQSSPAATPATTTGTAVTGSPGQSGPPSRPAPSGSNLPRPPASSQAAPLITNASGMVRGSGTINIALDANLYFDTGGKISKLKVKKGDPVTKNSLLASLDTTSLIVAAAQAKVTLDQAILSQKTAELAVETAKFNLDKTQAVTKIKDVITGLEWQIKIAQMNVQSAAVSGGDKDIAYWTKIQQAYQKDLTDETKILQDMLKDSTYSSAITYDIAGQAFDRLTVGDLKIKQLQIEAAQIAFDRAQDVVDQAQKSLDQAQKQLNGTEIYAPFDGVIVTVNYREGDTSPAPSPSQKPIIYMVDPSALQIVVIINELDIPRVKTGQSAIVKVDAFPNVKIEGKVTDISILPDIQGGTVNYDVTVSFTVPADSVIRSGMNGNAEISTG